VRRLLLRQRLYGTKVGSVWAIFPNDLERSSGCGAPQDGPVKSKGVRETGRRSREWPRSVFELEPIACSGRDSGSGSNRSAQEHPLSSVLWVRRFRGSKVRTGRRPRPQMSSIAENPRQL
jgi:hypothetical protein